MHTEPAVIAERGARSAHPTRPLATVSGAVEVFAIEFPRLRMSPSMPRLGACVANATVRLHLRQAPDEALYNMYFTKHNLPVPRATPPAPPLEGSQRTCPPATTYPLPGGETARPRRLLVPPPAASPGRPAHGCARRGRARVAVPVALRALHPPL